MAKKQKEPADNYAYWNEQIQIATKDYGDFHTGGDKVIDRYRIEKANGGIGNGQDRYNILYSSTETIRPSLYAQTPKVEVQKRHRDRKNPLVAAAVSVLESTISYSIGEIGIDEVMEAVIEDYTLPGLGQAWVRYEPGFEDVTGDDGEPLIGDDGNTVQKLAYEDIALDYVHWKDVLFGRCRVWKELPWAARRVYMSKAKATTRFGKDVADLLQYQTSSQNSRDRDAVIEDRQAIIWEIWDKTNKEVLWISEGHDKVLDRKPDPLHLKNFWPFPKPLRAVSNTRTFIPRPFYAQYQAQAEELDSLTQRIRFLSDALVVRGVYDSSQDALGALLNKGGNKLVPIENWSQFIGEKGINGAIQWVPIDMIVQVLMELYKARDIVKGEIYEITGFSDITRGLSKASETLGAQQIKQDWASGRLRIMQKEVQRFIKDIVCIIGEIAAEHFTDETFALYSGFDADPNDTEGSQQAVQTFKSALELLRKERERCANIDIETDSTILPDEERERADRLEFLGQIGAYLQQAGPMAMQYPQMGGLLMAMMMFSVRTFRASRPLEQEFEKFQEQFAANPPQQPSQDDGGAAKAQTALQVAQLKQQGDSERQDKELAFKANESVQDRQLELQKLQAQAASEQVQLQIKQAELEIKRTELAIKQAELGLKQQAGALEANDQAHRHSLEEADQAHQHASEDAQTALSADAQAHGQEMAEDDADRQDYQFANPQQNSEPGVDE